MKAAVAPVSLGLTGSFVALLISLFLLGDPDGSLLGAGSSVVALVGASIGRAHTRLSAALMVLAGTGTLAANPFGYVVPFLLLTVAAAALSLDRRPSHDPEPTRPEDRRLVRSTFGAVGLALALTLLVLVGMLFFYAMLASGLAVSETTLAGGAVGLAVCLMGAVGLGLALDR